MYRAKFKWSKLSAAIYGMYTLCMPCIPAYNDIYEHVGGEVYIAFPACNDTHCATVLYSVSNFLV